MNKFEIQHSQYQFPYHYIPYFDSNGVPSNSRKLNWGLEYLCYQRHLHERVIDLKPSSVLEVGCGDGYFLGGLPNTINRRIGVDLSDKAIAFAKAFHPHCDFRVEDVNNLNEKFDIVAVIEVLEHIPDDAVSEFLRALADKINDSGIVIISVPTTVLPLNKKHYRHYTKKILLDQVEGSECGLIIDRVEYVYTNPWWFKVFRRFFDNKIFSFELKPFMGYAWKSIWNNYRIVKESNGFHLVAYLKKAS
jgi:SAM-dependent methyltransferase